MSELVNAILRLSPEKQRLLTELLTPAPEPIAVIGMGCRFPGGVETPAAYWQFLLARGDGICDVPADRWNIDEYYDPDPAATGKMSTRQGGFLKQVDQFDAPFFGIAPREATRLDPQQRLLLEVSWEALENAGQSDRHLAGSDTGVFIGLTTTDYWWLQVPDLSQFDGHAVMGGAHCAAAGRLSHLLDLHGPNMAIDTACSSSLVAVHQACQSLHSKECGMALAGGVNVMASPLATTSLSKWGVLAPDGRCKTFDASANGFARAEGCGIVVLKRLSDAQAAGDPILAVIRGSAVNQDGRTTRFSAPNGLAQEAVLRKALASAGVAAEDLAYLEAHGTGTSLGDPIEVEALAKVYGAPRSGNRRCALGSVKANIGHTEAAAGVAGLIKTVLCLQHGVIPGQPHFQSLNPKITLDQTPFFVPQQTTPWPECGGQRLAAVSAFGLSGTNAHVIVEEPPRAVPLAGGEANPSAYLLPLSARSAEALDATARTYQAYLQEAKEDVSLQDIGYTASMRRTHHPYRVAVVGRTREELAERLQAACQNLSAAAPCFPGSPPKLVFVFSGQGCQWIGMGRRLLQQEAAFGDTLRACDAWLKQHAGWSLLDELAADESQSRLSQTEFVQPAIFAIQAGLVAQYRAWGSVPDAVIGHSAGEVAAAYAAGVLSLEEALRVVVNRARLMQRATGKGRMAAVGLSAAEAEQVIGGYGQRLAVAAMNGPQSSVLSGEPAALAEVLDLLQGRGVFCKDLGVNYAFHTQQMEAFVPELHEALCGLQPRAASIPIYSTVTGAAAEGERFDAGYWTRNMRQSVRFAAAIDCMLDDGCQVFLEIGPHPVLATPLAQCIRQRGAEATVACSLRQGQEDRASLLKSLAAMFAAGCEFSFDRLQAEGGRCVALPNYAWQRKRYWISEAKSPAHEDAAPRTQTAPPLSEHGANVISEFYDRVATMPEQDDRDSYLTFAPFVERVPGFSWLLAFYDPQQHPEQVDRIKAAQKQLREVLFRGIDFTAVRSMLDFGCGYGSDLTNLAEQHRHLHAHGYTLSAGQAEIGNRKIAGKGMQDRAAVYHRNSAKDEFPGQYDLVFGFEVAHYIQDKHKLFAHIDRHLNDSGFIVLADFVALTVSGIDHAQTNSFIITAPQWTELLAAYKLRVVECVDVSQEMANFLEDPDSETNLEYLKRQMGSQGDVRGHFGSYDGLGKLFRRKLASYTLFTIQKERYQTREEIARVNREKLAAQTPYAEALQRVGAVRTTDPGCSPHEESALADCLLSLSWQTRPLATSNGVQQKPSTWLVLADQAGVGEELAKLLRQRGDTCITVARGVDYKPLSADRFQVNAARPDDFRELLADALTTDLPPCRGIIHLWGLDLTAPARTTLHSLESDQAAACGSLLHVAQATSSIQWPKSPLLWVVTRGAQSCEESTPPALAQGPLWGMGRTLVMEQPALWGGLVDLDTKASSRDAAHQISDEILHSDGEDQVVLRGEHRYVARLQKTSLAVAASHGMTSLAPDASYLLTGGLGGLGLRAAKRLVQAGARHLLLVQRTALPPPSEWSAVSPESQAASQIAAVQELEAMGANIHLLSLDIAREDELARALNEARLTLPPLRGIIHAAGLLDDGVLSQLNWERFNRVMAPKLMGAWNLHRLTLSDPLDFFVMFSSAASLLGSPGQANYAAANAGLDALAAFRRQQGLPAVSINWGPWSEVGMAAADARRGSRVAELGIGSIAPDEGVEALLQLLSCDRGQIGVVPLNLEQLRQSWPAAANRPLLAEMMGLPAPRPSAPAAPVTTVVAPAPPVPAMPTQIRKQLLALGTNERRNLLKTYLAEQAAKVLQLSAKEIDIRRPLNGLGIDSLMAVELRNRIESDLSVSVPIVTFLEGGSLTDLTDKLLGGLPAVSAGGDDRMARALEQLSQMSDEAVKRRLAEQRQLAT